MKILLQIQFCLLLLISLLGKAQQITASDNLSCTDRQYLESTLGKCCSRCPPGSYAKQDCTETSDTQCQPCEDNKYSATWNYAKKCKTCKLCVSPLVEKEKCSSTKKEECVCPEGYECIQKDGMDVCMVCRPMTSPTTVMPSSEPSFLSDYPWAVPIIVIAVVITISVVLVLLYVQHNVSILEKLGCAAKVSKPLPESSGLEVTVSPVVESLLPSNGLHYPIEETNATQSAEYALNSTQRHPI